MTHDVPKLFYASMLMVNSLDNPKICFPINARIHLFFPQHSESCVFQKNVHSVLGFLIYFDLHHTMGQQAGIVPEQLPTRHMYPEGLAEGPIGQTG